MCSAPCFKLVITVRQCTLPAAVGIPHSHKAISMSNEYLFGHQLRTGHYCASMHTSSGSWQYLVTGRGIAKYTQTGCTDAQHPPTERFCMHSARHTSHRDSSTRTYKNTCNEMQALGTLAYKSSKQGSEGPPTRVCLTPANWLVHLSRA